MALFLTVSNLHPRHVCARFKLWDWSFLLLHLPRSHDHKGGTQVAVVFNRCLFTKVGGSLLEWIMTPHLDRYAADSLLHFQMCNWSFPQTLWGCGVGADPSCSWVSHPPGRTVVWLFRHLTHAKLYVTLTLWHIDLNTISNLVKAVPRTWRHCWGINPFYPNFILIDPIGRHSVGWYIVFGCDIVPADSLLNGTVHLGRDLFYRVVTSFCYSIPGWSVCTKKNTS